MLLSTEKYNGSDIVQSCLGGINQDGKFSYGNLVLTPRDMIFYDRKTEDVVPLADIVKVELVKGGPVFAITLKDGKVKEYRSGEAKAMVSELEKRIVLDAQALARLEEIDLVNKQKLNEVEIENRRKIEEAKERDRKTEEDKERQRRMVEEEKERQQKVLEEEQEKQRRIAKEEKEKQRKAFEDSILKDILNEETIKESFRYNDLETLFITNKRSIIIGKKSGKAEAKDSIPGVIPGVSLLKKAKALIPENDEPILFVQSAGQTLFPDLLLEEIKVDEGDPLDMVKDKAKEMVRIQVKKPKYSHKFTIKGLKDFDIEIEYLPNVWKTFKYMGT